MSRLVVDPVTRVGGQMRIEVEVEQGFVTDAWSSGTMFRGIEGILRGRDPRDAWLFAERVCGSCTGVHALASVRAVERALGVAVPRNARLVRNVLAGSRHAQDHAIGFYRLHALDWVDARAAATADPAATAALAGRLSSWPKNTAAYFASARERLAGLLATEQAGPLANGWWGHPACTLPPETGLMVMAHYLEALDWRRRVTRIQTILGGKDPHPQAFVVGGMVVSPPWGGPDRPLPGEHPIVPDTVMPRALGPGGMAELATLLAEVRSFVDEVYLPDVLAIADHHRDWLGIGAGVESYLAFGEYPEDDSVLPRLFLPGGRVMFGNLARVEPVQAAAIGETVAHAHYVDGAGDEPRHPTEAHARPRYAGPRPPVTTLENVERYSWVKAPRYSGEPLETGPLARMLVAYAEGRDEARAAVNSALVRLGGGQEVLSGTIGRLVARAVEASVVAGRLEGWLRDLASSMAGGDLALADITSWDPASWPRVARGWSLGEGAKGAVGHWVTIEDSRIAAYEIVDASTWNISPRDERGIRGPLEAALVGTPLADPARPVELLRTVHSFDPCAACAVHCHGGAGAASLEISIAARRDG